MSALLELVGLSILQAAKRRTVASQMGASSCFGGICLPDPVPVCRPGSETGAAMKKEDANCRPVVRQSVHSPAGAKKRIP